MKSMTNRALIVSLLLTPSMVLAKPAAKKKKKAKPAPAAVEQTEELNAPASTGETPPAPPAPPAYNPGYGMAGCGLGTYVIKEDGILQIFAATTNGTGYNQLFGITSGTSNCKEGGAAVAQEQKVFIDANLVSLKREAANGQGETLSAFADLLGCDAKTFNQVSKANYGKIYKASEADSILNGYKAVLNTQCTRLI